MPRRSSARCKQDRHSGIMGELGAAAEMIPVSVKVRCYTDGNAVLKEKDLNFNVFVHQKWTPYLMMVTLFNSISGMNEFADEATYRLSGRVELDGQPNLSHEHDAGPGRNAGAGVRCCWPAGGATSSTACSAMP